MGTQLPAWQREEPPTKVECYFFVVKFGMGCSFLRSVRLVLCLSLPLCLCGPLGGRDAGKVGEGECFKKTEIRDLAKKLFYWESR